MKKIIYSLLIMLLLNTNINSQSIENLATTTIISNNDLHKAGILNIADIFLLTHNITKATIDGNNLFLNHNYLSPLQEQESIIMIDGLPCEINLFGNQNTQVLPITIEQIDYIEIINSPIFFNGKVNSNGIINIHTKKPLKDLTIRLGYNVGNEKGDPGPFAFLLKDSRNVDKLPVNFNVNLNYKGSKGYFITAFKTMDGFATDKAIEKRILSVSKKSEKFDLSAFSFKLRYTKIGKFQDFFFGYSENKNYFFLTPYGNEIPLNHTYKQFGVNGLFNLSKVISLNYNISQTENILADWNAKSYQSFNWTFNTTSAKIASSYKLNSFHFSFGLKFKRYEGITEQKFQKNIFENKEAFWQLKFNSTKNLVHNLGVLVLKGENKWIVRYSSYNQLKIGNSSISSVISLSENILAESNYYWKWYNQGYTFFEKEKIKTDKSPPFSLGKKFVAELHFHSRLKSNFSFNISASYKDFFNYTIYRQQFFCEKETHKCHSPTEVFTNEALKSLTINGTIKYKFSKYFSNNLNFTHQQILSGSKIFKENWKTLPIYKISYDISIQPSENFSVWIQLNYFDKTKWHQYKYIEYQTNNFYSNTIGGKILLNLSLQNWFWNKKLWLNISFRNLLDKNEKYYPIGSEINLRAYAQIKLYLNSVLN